MGVWPLGLLLLKNEVNRRDTKTLVNDLEQNKTRSFVWYVQRFGSQHDVCVLDLDLTPGASFYCRGLLTYGMEGMVE